MNKISGSWDDQLVARLLADLQADVDLDISMSGFGEDEIKDLLRSLDARERADQPEAFELESALEEARREPRSKPGDLWALGDHRLLCGDATDPAAVARVLGDAKPRLLATDPPYGVSLDPRWRDGVHNELGPAEKPYMRVDGQWSGQEATSAPAGATGAKQARRSRGHWNVTLSGDTRVDWSEAFALVPSLDVGYVWHAGVHAAEVAMGLKAIGFEIVAQGIWDKGLFAMGRSWFHWSHEPCWVLRRRGAKVPFLGTHDQGTVWRVPSPKMIMSGSNEPKQDHPAQKPVLLYEIPIRNHTKPGEATYDPFLGSGTALIAAERHARVCYGLEDFDPVFCDVIVSRFERFTGKAAEKVDG